MPVRENDSHKSVSVHTVSYMEPVLFKGQEILLSTELKVYCMCIWKLANPDTSTSRMFLAHTKQQMAKINLVAIGAALTP